MTYISNMNTQEHNIQKLHSSFFRGEYDFVEEVYDFIVQSPSYLKTLRPFMSLLRVLSPKKFGAIIGTCYAKKLLKHINDEDLRAQLFHLPLIIRGESKIIDSIVCSQYKEIAANYLPTQVRWSAMYLASDARKHAAISGLSCNINMMDAMMHKEEIRQEIKKIAIDISKKGRSLAA